MVVGWFGMALTEMVNLNVLRRVFPKIRSTVGRKKLAKKPSFLMKLVGFFQAFFFGFSRDCFVSVYFVYSDKT